MSAKATVATALGLALAALAAGLAIAPIGGAAHRAPTVAFVADDHPFGRAVARGGRAAAKALGIRFVWRSPSDQTGAYNGAFESLIAQHVDAIATAGYDPTLKPVLDKVRAAGIPLLSSGDDIAGKRTLWVSQSESHAYAQSLADALASQMKNHGEYAIVGATDEYPIASKWTRLARAYIARTYPAMKLDGVVLGTDAGDPSEASALEGFMAAHPKLSGLLAIVPTEAWMAAEAITRAHKVGRVFSAGNAGADFTAPLPGWVRSGAAEFVFASDPIKLGYLTVWAANYLLTGHRFRPGAYQVGGPIGLVWYYPKHQELRLGQPLTVTKANVDVYANSF
jgi:rhamnose transport system substrate-binding protein